MWIAEYIDPTRRGPLEETYRTQHPHAHFHLCAVCGGSIGGFALTACPLFQDEDHVKGICCNCRDKARAENRTSIETRVGVHTLSELLTLACFPSYDMVWPI